jgi:hypothetical protein
MNPVKYRYEAIGPINIPEKPGFLIRCFPGLDGWPQSQFYIPIGHIYDQSLLTDLLKFFAGHIGPQKRIDLYNYIKQYTQVWPISDSGIPAYLSTFRLYYRNNDGSLIEYVLKVVDEI